MTNFSHLTNEELVREIKMRDDLTALEHELLDRLIVAIDELAGFANQQADLITQQLI